MILPTNMTELTSLLSQLGHKRVAQLVMAALLAYIAYVGATITWSVVPQAQSNQNTAYVTNTRATNTANTKSVDVAKIQSLNLFGLYNENDIVEAEVEMSNVPETKLNLTLSGLVASDDKSIAAAIIENQGKQETYGIGDIITGTRANLEKVLMDRVLIKQSGRLETLMLDGFDYSQPAQNVKNKPAAKRSQTKVGPHSSRSGIVDKRNDKELTTTAKSLRTELSQDPAKIGDYLRISPKRKDGKIIGYSLRPGKKPEFFKQSGLKSGDVAIEMNGYDLIAPAQAMQAMVEMKKARDISLLVNRQGSLTEILISLD
ncbi:general secretion pathway protein C [Colwellia psychrerythraea]|uniref:General secretion pathway protein C n=2 Tax=Colwellia psychrerythraea TaxID=28229 RepID=A0A099KQ83_COLPS|nr:general secretion pathway protein C [Colwellia psychrerythraea]